MFQNPRAENVRGDPISRSEGRRVILEYQSASATNRDIFLLNHSYAFHAFGGLHDHSNLLGRMLQTGRDKTGKSYVSFLPFLLLIQRQALTAFQMLWAHQSYQAWVLLRPALESALIMGKWVDNPVNATVWRNGDVDRKRYAKIYTGAALRSENLPRSAELQKVLSRINDDFMHLNPSYYSRHTTVADSGSELVSIMVRYFDDARDHEAHVLAFLHLMATVQDSLAAMFGERLADVTQPKAITTELEAELQERLGNFVSANPDRLTVLRELGLWSIP